MSLPFTLIGACPGDYVITGVEDDAGCSGSFFGMQTVDGPSDPMLAATLLAPAFCNDPSVMTQTFDFTDDAVLDLTLDYSVLTTTGTVTFYSADPGTIPAFAIPSITLTGTAITPNVDATGNYVNTDVYIEYIDESGCPVLVSVTLDASGSCCVLPVLTSTLTSTCNGESDGAIDLTLTGGIGTFNPAWSNMATTEDLTGLSAGSYSVTVTSATDAMCSTTATYEILEFSQPTCVVVSTDTSCGEDNGSVTVTANTGTAPYSYAWSNGGTAAVNAGLADGTYTVTVTDDNGCETTCSGTIAASTSPSCTVSSVDTCLLYTSPSPRDATLSRMPSSA